MKNHTPLFSILAAIILITANVGAGFFLIAASQESQINRSHLQALHQNRQSQEQLQADLLSQETAIDQMQAVLPTETEIPEFMQSITDAGKALGLDIDLSFSTNQPTKTKEGLFVVAFVVTFQADSNKIAPFIASLHQGIYQVRFQQITLQQSKDKPANIRLDGQVYVASPTAPSK